MTRALFIGRFQPFHNAHLRDVKDILKESDEIIIGIGSSNEENTPLNPFSFSERKRMIAKVLKANKIRSFKIYPIPDLHDDKKWVDYIKKNLPRFDLVYSGNPWTIKCFKKHNSGVKKIKLIKGISSTIVRDNIAKGKQWKQMVPKEIYEFVKNIGFFSK